MTRVDPKWYMHRENGTNRTILLTEAEAGETMDQVWKGLASRALGLGINPYQQIDGWRRPLPAHRLRPKTIDELNREINEHLAGGA